MNFRNIDPLGWAILIITFIAAIAFAFCNNVQAQTIGFNYSRAANESAWGVHGDLEKRVRFVDLELEAQLQSGDLYVGNVDVSAQFNVKSIGIKLSSLNQLQGPTLAGLGRQNTLDLAFVMPISDVDIAIGVFGQNGNPFAPQYELSDPLDPLSEVIESEAGITIPEGNRWGISAAVGWNVSIFEIDGKALLDPNNITHQGRIGIGTGGDLSFVDGLGWSAKVNLALQSHKVEDVAVVEIQNDMIVSIDYLYDRLFR